VVEAEHFFKQEKDDVRAWYLTTKDKTPDLQPDADQNHTARASGGGGDFTSYIVLVPWNSPAQ